jgi:hypothetical protein
MHVVEQILNIVASEWKCLLVPAAAVGLLLAIFSLVLAISAAVKEDHVSEYSLLVTM